MALADRVRVGGRSARIQASVHQAVKTLLAEVERVELTIPAIAERAGVTPSTIYRRWGDLSDLLADVAVERLRPTTDPVDTGWVVSDLRKWTEQYMEEMSSEVGRAMIRDVLTTTQNEKTVDRCCAYTTDQLCFISDRAAARGDPGFDVDDFLDRVVAPIMYRILFSRQPLTLAYGLSLVDRVFPKV